MSIRVNLPGIESQSSSVRTMCQAYIEAMGDVKVELQTFIMDVSLQGKTYRSAKSYFSEIYIPLADGIILLCERLMQAHEQFPQQYKENVDTNSLTSDDLAKQIKSLGMLIQAFEAQAATTMIGQGLFHQRIMMYKHMREKVSATLDRLVEFDTSSANIFSDIQELLADVETGLNQIKNRKAWNPTTETFYIKDWDLSWASNIKSKKKIKAMEGDDVTLQNGDAKDEEAQLKAF